MTGISRVRGSDFKIRQTSYPSISGIMTFSRIKSGGDNYVRQTAARTLRRIGDAQAIEPLSQALQDADKDVRQEAVRALNTIIPVIDTVFFGYDTHKIQFQNTVWYNPYVSEYTVALQKLQRIVIDASICDFKLVEKFLTYAVNMIGQNYLKKYVTTSCVTFNQ